MPRRKVQFVKGGYYHLYNRGAGRQSIFRSDENYLYLLGLMKNVLKEVPITMIAYCLMPNHYHWLVRQDGDVSVNVLPARVFGSYTRAFNKRYQRSGTLFEDRFDAIPVEDDGYLHHLCRYIHGNPVKDGFAITPELWEYSNYREWLQLRKGTLFDSAFVQAHFPNIKRYQRSVHDYLGGRLSLPEKLRQYLLSLEL